MRPMPARIDSDPAARPVAVLLVAGGFVLACQLENGPSEEPEVLAALMAHEVLQAVARCGVRPPQLCVGQRPLAEALRGALAPHGIAVALVAELPGVERALRSLLGHVFGGILPLERLRSQPATWAGWGMPAALVARMFEAAAAFRRAAPWEVVPGDFPIAVSRPGEEEWVAVVLGAAGEQLGLALYQDPEDFARLMASDADDPGSAFDDAQGLVVSLVFNVREELPKPMRAEIKGAGWPVAGSDAYPSLLVLNTPGGGIREGDFRFLVEVLEALPRFVAAHEARFADAWMAHGAVAWRDGETGVAFRLEADEAEDVLSWHEALAPSGPTGPGATPGAVVDEAVAARVVADTVTRFRGWLQDPSVGKPLGNTMAGRHAENARLFVELVVHAGGKPISAVTEFDLRDFLYHWYPMHVMDTESGARGTLVALRRFFTFLRDREGVVCPWATALLADTEHFLSRWDSCPDPLHPDLGDAGWHVAGTLELVALVLLPDLAPAGPLQFGAAMGPVESALDRALQRSWLVWRDEVIASGVVAPRAVLAALQARAAVWATTPLAAAGETPVAAIARERAALRRQERVRARGPGRRAPRRG